MARAEQFAGKIGGSVVVGINGRASVNYNVGGTADGGMTITSKSNFGDFSSWKNFKETMRGFDSASQGSGGNEYTGTKGMREFGEDMGKGSTYVKATGVLVAGASVIAGPETIPVGVGIYRAGDAIDNISTGLTIGADLDEGKVGDAAIKGAAMYIDNKIGNKIESGAGSQLQKLATEATTGAVIDNAKDNLLDK
jgi:hypothetical protein